MVFGESSSGIRPTLNIFPSQPMHVEPSSKESGSFASASSSGSKRPSDSSIRHFVQTKNQKDFSFLSFCTEKYRTVK
ncbi:hypothetical protein ACHQM5_026696 [Ranunculus cassubicifolius]